MRHTPPFRAAICAAVLMLAGCTAAPQTDAQGFVIDPDFEKRLQEQLLDAKPGSVDDIYQHNPWRAPGAAPVADACGLAGGTMTATLPLLRVGPSTACVGVGPPPHPNRAACAVIYWVPMLIGC